MNLWPCGTPKSTNNAFDMSEIRPSVLYTEHGERAAKKQAQRAALMTATERVRQITRLKPITGHNVIVPTKGPVSFYPK